MELYGVESTTSLQEIQDKMKDSCMKKYGVEYASQSNIFQDKCKKSCLEKYGVEHPSQDPETFSRMQNGYKPKHYTFPSGITKDVQGYEYKALNRGACREIV